MDAILQAKGSTELCWALGSAFVFAAGVAREFKLPVTAVLLLAVSGLLFYGVSIVLALLKRRKSTMHPQPHRRTPKGKWLRWRPLVLLILTILLPFAFYYWRFAAWGLPWDLQFRQSHLKTLRIAAKLTSWSWVSDDLKTLILTRAEASDFEHLPKKVEEFGLRNGSVDFSSSLPDSIARLDLRGTDGTIRSWPTGLNELKLAGRMVDHLDPARLPSTLTRLVLGDCQQLSLSQLPSYSGITYLDLDCRSLQSLDGLPQNLETLVLRNTQLSSLHGVPASVARLVLINNRSMNDIRALPPRLTSLYIQGSQIAFGDALRTSSLKELSIDWAIDVAELPRTVTALSVVPGFTGSQVHLPPNIRSLKILKSKLQGIVEWGQLQCLDLGFDDAPLRYGDLPRKLSVLRTSIGEDLSLHGLPEQLTALHLREMKAIEIGPWDLSWVPPSVTRLEIDWLGAPGFRSLPRNLETLRLTNMKHLVELPDLRKLPLKELSVQNSGISELPPLPLSLRHLDIANSNIRHLSGLPSKLQSLRVSPNQLTSLWGLWGLPKSVEELSFEDDEGGGIPDEDWRISACEAPSR